MNCFVEWKTMDSAPKGRDDDGESIYILLSFPDGEMSVGYWDEYYAEGGCGYEGGLAWIEPVSGERLDLHYGAPVAWAWFTPIDKEVK